MAWLKNWKLKLRYGKLETAFHHMTLIADGVVKVSNPAYGTLAGATAFLTVKAWAVDSDEAISLLIEAGTQLGFDVNGPVSIYKTDPEQPPGALPYV